MPVLAHHPSAGWSIRPATRGDADGIVDVFRDCLVDFPWRGDPVAQARDLVRAMHAHTTFVAEEPQAGIIGFLLTDSGVAYVPYLFVQLDWRLCGVGRTLLRLARQEAGRPLTLDVDEANRAGRAAYEALGWRVAATSRGRRGHRQIRMLSP